MFDFFKKRKAAEPVPTTPETTAPETSILRDFLGDPKYTEIHQQLIAASKFLNVQLPSIYLVDYMANIEDENGNMMLCAMDSIGVNDAPIDAGYVLAHFDHNSHIILHGMYVPYHKRELTDAERLFLLLHELRHLWQFAYHSDAYYSAPNAVNELEHLNDLSEIDADAFALAYMRTHTTYPETDYFPLVGTMFVCDSGQRFLRTEEVIKTEFATAPHSGGKL